MSHSREQQLQQFPHEPFVLQRRHCRIAYTLLHAFSSIHPSPARCRKSGSNYAIAVSSLGLNEQVTKRSSIIAIVHGDARAAIYDR